MKQWHFIIDVEKCENCNNCFLACKDEHCGNDWPGYAAAQPRHGHRWMNIHQRERGRFPVIDVAYLPMPCMHCADAPCIRAASGGAVFRRPDGIVIIDPEKARGRKDLVKSCPYGAIWWNEEKSLPQKCTFCAHLLDDGWKAPRCVQACPTGALTVMHIDASALAEMIRTQGLETLDKEKHATRPGVYYKNLYRFNQMLRRRQRRHETERNGGLCGRRDGHPEQGPQPGPQHRDRRLRRLQIRRPSQRQRGLPHQDRLRRRPGD